MSPAQLREARIRKAVIRWHQTRHADTGMSSEAMAWHLARAGWPGDSTPCDPSDFNRCLKLLKSVPALRKRLSRMRKVSPEWGRLIDHWEELESLYDEEAAQGTGYARRLYKRLKELGL